MLILLFSLNLTLSLIFMFLTHPLSAGLILLMQTIIISLITSNFYINFWFSYILFLIMIGGMLILFIYMTSIASNEKFFFDMKSMMITMIIPSITLIFYYLNYLFSMNFMNNEMLIFNKTLINSMTLNKYFSYPLNMILLFIIIYLFITLIAVVKITNFNKGPLRQMN
uniref:NADH-ubiquinone oxidoreductase chain 6 n=1 Tax=Salpingus aeneus TaxID=1227471 RepID=S4SUW0_9CUCU|nr:NADH dehydrogenase subunit 6 [Salpingus aeneus]